MGKRREKRPVSAGHQLGQLVGDWYEQYFALPLLQGAADRLKLYLDHRFRTRAARGDRLLWADQDGNKVDYDFVIELDGSEQKLGIPVAFVESFWRRGARHSKDKARDDSGKLAPMRDTYPTARFLGIIAAGDFTAPARQFVQSRQIDLFYVPKTKVVAAFAGFDRQIDYPDRAAEQVKNRLVRAFQQSLTDELKPRIADRRRELVGAASLTAYTDRVRAAIGALPQELRFCARRKSKPVIFETIAEASAFLGNPDFAFGEPSEDFIYAITYTDGTEFERAVDSIDELQELHRHIERLGQHVAALVNE